MFKFGRTAVKTRPRVLTVLEELRLEDNQGIEVERVEDERMYLKGFKYPFKGVPTIEKIEKANEIKKAIKSFKSLEDVRQITATFHSFAAEIYGLVYKLTRNQHMAYCISFVLEYDQGYSLRLQDLFNETSKEKLKNPLEILRLSKIHKGRDIDGHVHKKLKYFFWLLALYSILPRWRKAIEQVDFSKLQMDVGDRYWACMKYDYDYMGKSYQQRQDMIAKGVV
jgi:hypothetical protein